MVFAALAFDNSGTLHTAGSNGLVSSFSPAELPFQSTAPQVFGMTDAAGGSLITGRVWAGEVISIYGTNLGPASGVSGKVNSQGLVPTALGGVQVMIDGVAGAAALCVFDADQCGCTRGTAHWQRGESEPYR